MKFYKLIYSFNCLDYFIQIYKVGLFKKEYITMISSGTENHLIAFKESYSTLNDCLQNTISKLLMIDRKERKND